MNVNDPADDAVREVRPVKYSLRDPARLQSSYVHACICQTESHGESRVTDAGSIEKNTGHASCRRAFKSRSAPEGSSISVVHHQVPGGLVWSP